MASCKDCLHVEVCDSRCPDPNNERLICDNYKDRSRFVKLKSAVWCKHKPELSKMEKFHEQGLGLGMNVNSVFWTCSNCGTWGSLIYKYCPQCGAEIQKEREENA